MTKKATIQITVWNGEKAVTTRTVEVDGIEYAKSWAETCIHAIKNDDIDKEL